jgi:O-antigen/teichoic acid export membrane protein
VLFGAVAKIVFRLGLDAGFFRIHYDLDDEAGRRALAGTVALFTAGFGGLLLLATGLFARPLTTALLGPSVPASWIVLVAADVYLASLASVPAALLRIQERPAFFSAVSAGRHALNTVLKVVLVARGHGVSAVVWSDALASAAYASCLLPVLARHASLTFSTRLLREALGFGLPKVPHGILVQVQNVADRKILDFFVSRAEVGLYHMGYTFGTMVKFPLSAFEPAWQPFVYARLREEDAPRTLARVAGVAFAAFVGVGLGVAVFGPDLLVLMTRANPAFAAAAPVVPVVALAYVLHGFFLLTSVGIGIRKEARYYPLITAAAAAANLAGNLFLIPRLGIVGAAWATVLSYAVMAGLGLAISQRLYPLPIPWGCVGAIGGAALASYAVSCLAPAALVPGLAVKAAALAAFVVAAVALSRLADPPALRARSDASRASPPE